MILDRFCKSRTSSLSNFIRIDRCTSELQWKQKSYFLRPIDRVTVAFSLSAITHLLLGISESYFIRRFVSVSVKSYNVVYVVPMWHITDRAIQCFLAVKWLWSCNEHVDILQAYALTSHISRNSQPIVINLVWIDSSWTCWYEYATQFREHQVYRVETGRMPMSPKRTQKVPFQRWL